MMLHRGSQPRLKDDMPLPPRIHVCHLMPILLNFLFVLFSPIVPLGVDMKIWAALITGGQQLELKRQKISCSSLTVCLYSEDRNSEMLLCRKVSRYLCTILLPHSSSLTVGHMLRKAALAGAKRFWCPTWFWEGLSFPCTGLKNAGVAHPWLVQIWVWEVWL